MIVARGFSLAALGLAIVGCGWLLTGVVPGQASRADDKPTQATRADTKDADGNNGADKDNDQHKSNEKFSQPKLIEHAYPLDGQDDRAQSVQLLQQLTVDLLSVFNIYKEAHWNLNGPLYLILHEYYQQQADYYRKQADVFAERVLHMGYSVDGRWATIAKTSRIPNFPAGYVTDDQSLQLLIERVTVLQKEIYKGIHKTEKSDPPTSNKLQDLAYAVDKNLWQLRVHLQKPGSRGKDLPWSNAQGQVGAAK